MSTYSGNLPQKTDWEETWETFFSKSLRQALELEQQVKGPDPAFDVLVPIIFDKVIPRLLRPLKSEGRALKPSLVHGDLWYGNSGLDVETDESLVFDACYFYAHNECKLLILLSGWDSMDIVRLTHLLNQDEFGQWRPICNRFDKEYLAAYHSYIEISPPEEDYDGRLDLYKL